MANPTRIVIVEDDFLIAEYLRQLCTEFGAEVVGHAEDADRAIELIKATAPDQVLMDLRLRGHADGVDVANAVHPENPHLRITYITGSNEPASMERIRTDHPHQILIKPIEPRQLQAAISG